MIGRLTQEVIQESNECEVADDPVVVSKARPVKPSNGVEDKTKPTFASSVKGRVVAKSAVSCEGVKHTLRL